MRLVGIAVAALVTLVILLPGEDDLTGGERVGAAFIWLVFCGIVWGLIRLVKSASRAASPAGSRALVPQRPQRNNSAARADHAPPVPSGSPVQPWSLRSRRLEVAGEFYRIENHKRLFQGIPIDGPDGAELHLPACLVPDPSNPHDRNAVAVFVRGLHLGYMERDDAAQYFSAVNAVAERGEQLEVESRQWARFDRYRAETFARVTLQLPPPSELSPVNEIPDRAVVLPSGSTIQVTREDEHMEAIRPWLRDGVEAIPVAVTLTPIKDVRPRSVVDAIQVEIDGEPVGVLTPVSTANLMPLVAHVIDNGGVPVCRASLRGNALKADISLHVAKAQDVDAGWIESIGKIRVKAEPESPSRPAYEWDD